MYNKHLSYLKDLKKIRKTTPIRVGTDCSGIEAPIHALQLMKIPFIHEWACDNDNFVRQSITCNYSPRVFYDDILSRVHKKLPKIDLYVAGFPCQTFSSLGKRMGFDDITGKGIIFFECYKTIMATTPKVFILENVKGLTTHDRGNTFNTILHYLESLGTYNINYQIINTQDYGIPQNRERIYIIGTKNKKFVFPKSVILRVHIEDIIESIDKNRFLKLGELTEHKVQLLRELIYSGKINDLSDNWFVNLNVSAINRTGVRKDICPC